MKISKKPKYEEKVIEGKEVRIKIINQLHGAWASFNNKTIMLNEKTKTSLTKEELESVLYHERGHFILINNLLTYFPIFAILLIGIRFFISYKKLITDILFTNIPIISTLVLLIILIFSLVLIYWIIKLPFSWAKEILADWYSVKRTKKDIFRKTLSKFYKYNKENSKASLNRFYRGVILHPPQPIRLKVIELMEKARDKKKDFPK